MDSGTVRLDKWLWATRLFKTRRLAAQAARARRILVNHQVAKPGKLLRIGDFVTIRRPQSPTSLKVIALVSRRLPASEAQGLYEETAESIRNRESEASLRRATRTASPSRRPGKKERRAIIRFNRSVNSDPPQNRGDR